EHGQRGGSGHTLGPVEPEGNETGRPVGGEVLDQPDLGRLRRGGGPRLLEELASVLGRELMIGRPSHPDDEIQHELRLGIEGGGLVGLHARTAARASTSAACFSTTVPLKKSGFTSPQKRTAFSNMKSRKSSSVISPCSTSS